MAVFRLRRGTVRDVDLLVRLRGEMDRELGGPGANPTVRERARYRRWLDARVRQRLVIPFLAETRRGDPAASAVLWLREVAPRPGRKHARIPRLHAVYTRPEFRRRGAAELVVGAALRWARERGYPQVALRTTDQARSLYEKLGFRPVPEMVLQLESRRGAKTPRRRRRNRKAAARGAP